MKLYIILLLVGGTWVYWKEILSKFLVMMWKRECWRTVGVFKHGKLDEIMDGQVMGPGLLGILGNFS